MTRQEKAAAAVRALRKASHELNMQATALEVIKFPTDDDLAKAAKNASGLADAVLDAVERLEAP